MIVTQMMAMEMTIPQPSISILLLLIGEFCLVIEEKPHNVPQSKPSPAG
jgi:hypothetical protein